MTNIEKWLVEHEFILKDSNERSGRIKSPIWRIYGKGSTSVYVFLTYGSWMVEDTSDLSYGTPEEKDERDRALKSLCQTLSQLKNPLEETDES